MYLHIMRRYMLQHVCNYSHTHSCSVMVYLTAYICTYSYTLLFLDALAYCNFDAYGVSPPHVA